MSAMQEAEVAPRSFRTALVRVRLYEDGPSLRDWLENPMEHIFVPMGYRDGVDAESMLVKRP